MAILRRMRNSVFVASKGTSARLRLGRMRIGVREQQPETRASHNEDLRAQVVHHRCTAGHLRGVANIRLCLLPRVSLPG